MENDRQKFAEGMNMLGAAWSVEIDSLKMRAYWVGLVNKLSIEQFENAVSLALEECDRMPSPVQLKHFGQRSLQSAYRQLPPMSDEEKKRIRESWPQKDENEK